MSLKDKVTISYMLNQSKTWQDNHKVTVESEGKNPPVTLTMIYKMVVNINNRLDKFEQYVLDQFKKHGWVK